MTYHVTATCIKGTQQSHVINFPCRYCQVEVTLVYYEAGTLMCGLLFLGPDIM